MKTTKNAAILVLALVGLVVFLQLVFAGGALEPTAPPGPIFKTLDEVEPRIPISQGDIPLTISLPGSYYLTECVSATGIAITVDANDVTIDLAGFVITGPGSGPSYGIYMDGRSNVEIRNGTVRDFRYGIMEVNASGQDHRVIDVRALSNGLHGIYLDGCGHLVKDCTARDNGDSATSGVYGIYVGYFTSTGIGSTVTGNVVRNNGTGATGLVIGISAGNGSTVTGNTSYNNGAGATYFVQAIHTGGGSTVTGNTIRSNGDSSTASGVRGIEAGSGCTITGNTISYNGIGASGDVRGIFASGGSTVIGNTANGNGGNASSYGIYLGGANLVDQNTAYANNGTNMDLTVTSCTYGKNHAP